MMPTIQHPTGWQTLETRYLRQRWRYPSPLCFR